MGAFRRTPAGDIPLEIERVEPGCALEVFIVFTAVGGSDGHFRHRIEFQTNDSTHPQAAVDVIGEVELGIYAEPRQWHLGRLRPGETFHGRITIVDARREQPRMLFQIVVTSPTLSIGQSQVSAAAQQARETEQQTSYEVHVTVTAPMKPGEIREKLLIKDASGRDLFVLPVIGVSRGEIAIAPSVIVFKADSRGGKGERTRRCLCSGSGPFALRVIECPDGVTASISEGTDAAQKVVTLRYDTVPAKRRGQLVLAAEDKAGHSEVLEVSVVVAVY